MPTVGKMKFQYTEQGMKDAQNYSKQTGKPMQMEGGGMIPQYGHGGMVPSRPNPMGGPFPQPIGPRRYAPRIESPDSMHALQKLTPPILNQFQGGIRGPFMQRFNYVPNKPQVPVSSISNKLEPGETSPLPPGAGMRPPVNPGLMGRMNQGARKALMNRLAKFKKKIV